MPNPIEDEEACKKKMANLAKYMFKTKKYYFSIFVWHFLVEIIYLLLDFLVLYMYNFISNDFFMEYKFNAFEVFVHEDWTRTDQLVVMFPHFSKVREYSLSNRSPLPPKSLASKS